MKEGWTYKKLGEICDILNGFAFKSSTYVADGIRVIRISNVQKGKVEDKDPKFFPSSSKGEIENYLLNEGDLLISLTGNVGRVGILLRELLPAALNQRVACLRLKRDNIDKRYLFHFLNSDYFESICIKNSKGAAQLNMSTVWLSNYAIPIPSLSEQQRIVARLDSAFAHIDEVKANAEKQLRNAQALFQKALTKAMEPKEGWVSMKLGDFAYMKAGDFVKASDIYQDYTEGLYPCYGGNGLRGYVKEPNQEGDFCLIGRQGALCGCVNRAKGIFRTTEHAVIVKPYQEIPTSLVYYLLKHLNLNKYATGAAQPGLSVKNIAEQVIITVPPLSEQQRIVARLDSLSAHVRELEEIQKKIIAECDALKQALLRKVFE